MTLLFVLFLFSTLSVAQLDESSCVCEGFVEPSATLRQTLQSHTLPNLESYTIRLDLETPNSELFHLGTAHPDTVGFWFVGIDLEAITSSFHPPTTQSGHSFTLDLEATITSPGISFTETTQRVRLLCSISEETETETEEEDEEYETPLIVFEVTGFDFDLTLAREVLNGALEALDANVANENFKVTLWGEHGLKTLKEAKRAKDSHFILRSILPGSYLIRVNNKKDDEMITELSIRVTESGTSIPSDLVLTLPGLTLSGSIEGLFLKDSDSDSSFPKQIQAVLYGVSSESESPDSSFLLTDEIADTDVDMISNTYQFDNVKAGSYRLAIRVLPLVTAPSPITFAILREEWRSEDEQQWRITVTVNDDLNVKLPTIEVSGVVVGGLITIPKQFLGEDSECGVEVELVRSNDVISSSIGVLVREGLWGIGDVSEIEVSESEELFQYILSGVPPSSSSNSDYSLRVKLVSTEGNECPFEEKVVFGEVDGITVHAALVLEDSSMQRIETMPVITSVQVCGNLEGAPLSATSHVRVRFTFDSTADSSLLVTPDPTTGQFCTPLPYSTTPTSTFRIDVISSLKDDVLLKYVSMDLSLAEIVNDPSLFVQGFTVEKSRMDLYGEIHLFETETETERDGLLDDRLFITVEKKLTHSNSNEIIVTNLAIAIEEDKTEFTIPRLSPAFDYLITLSSSLSSSLCFETNSIIVGMNDDSNGFNKAIFRQSGHRIGLEFPKSLPIDFFSFHNNNTDDQKMNLEIIIESDSDSHSHSDSHSLCVRNEGDSVRLRDSCFLFPESIFVASRNVPIVINEPIAVKVKGKINGLVDWSNVAEILIRLENNNIERSDEINVVWSLREEELGVFWFWIPLVELLKEKEKEISLSFVSESLLLSHSEMKIKFDFSEKKYYQCIEDLPPITVSKGVLITGSVLERSTNIPVSGASISVLRLTDNVIIETILTDTEGTYRIGPLEDVPYQISAEARGFRIDKMGHSEFVADPYSSLSVQVKDNNEKGMGLEGVLVSITGISDRKFRRKLTSDRDGMAYVEDMVPGRYYVKVSLKEYSFSQQSTLLEVIERKHSLEIEATRTAFSVFGSVRSLNGQPLPGTILAAKRSDTVDAEIEERAKTDSDGLYRLRGLSSGVEYVVSLQSGGGEDVTVRMEREDVLGVDFVDMTLPSHPSYLKFFGQLRLIGDDEAVAQIHPVYFRVQLVRRRQHEEKETIVSEVRHKSDEILFEFPPQQLADTVANKGVSFVVKVLEETSGLEKEFAVVDGVSNSLVLIESWKKDKLSGEEELLLQVIGSEEVSVQQRSSAIIRPIIGVVVFGVGLALARLFF